MMHFFSIELVKSFPSLPSIVIRFTFVAFSAHICFVSFRSLLFVSLIDFILTAFLAYFHISICPPGRWQHFQDFRFPQKDREPNFMSHSFCFIVSFAALY